MSTRAATLNPFRIGLQRSGTESDFDYAWYFDCALRLDQAMASDFDCDSNFDCTRLLYQVIVAC
jgi:hypothetical protein